MTGKPATLLFQRPIGPKLNARALSYALLCAAPRCRARCHLLCSSNVPCLCLRKALTKDAAELRGLQHFKHGLHEARELWVVLAPDGGRSNT